MRIAWLIVFPLIGPLVHIYVFDRREDLMGVLITPLVYLAICMYASPSNMSRETTAEIRKFDRFIDVKYRATAAFSLLFLAVFEGGASICVQDNEEPLSFQAVVFFGLYMPYLILGLLAQRYYDKIQIMFKTQYANELSQATTE